MSKMIISEDIYKKSFINGYKYLLDMGINEKEIASVFGTTRITNGNDKEIEQAFIEAITKLEGRLAIQMLVQALGYDYEEEKVLYRPPPNFVCSEENGIIKMPDKEKLEWLPYKKEVVKKHQSGNSTLFTLFMTNKFPKCWKVTSELVNKKIESYESEPGKRDRKKIESIAAQFLANDTNRPQLEHSV